MRRQAGRRGERDREGDRGVRLAEVLRDGRQRHHDQEKIERVEHPAEETGGDGRVLIAGGSAGRCHCASKTAGAGYALRKGKPRGGGEDNKGGRAGREGNQKKSKE